MRFYRDSKLPQTFRACCLWSERFLEFLQELLKMYCTSVLENTCVALCYGSTVGCWDGAVHRWLPAACRRDAEHWLNSPELGVALRVYPLWINTPVPRREKRRGNFDTVGFVLHIIRRYGSNSRTRSWLKVLQKEVVPTLSVSLVFLFVCSLQWLFGLDYYYYFAFFGVLFYVWAKFSGRGEVNWMQFKAKAASPGSLSLSLQLKA